MGKVTLIPVLFANGVLEHILKCLIKPKELKVARTQPVSRFTLSEMGTQHMKFRSGERQCLLAKPRH